MKYIITFLSIVFLLTLSINVFAQAENSDKQITLEELNVLEQQSSVPQSADVLTEEEKTQVKSCDDLSISQVEIEITSPRSELISGMNMSLEGQLKNMTNSTISNATLYIKIFKENSNKLDSNIVDQFIVQDNITIPANTSVPVSFNWIVPSTAESGSYKIAAFMYTDKKFDISGFLNSNNIMGGYFDFSVSGEEAGGVQFDKSSILINDQNYVSSFTPVVVSESGKILISAPVRNTKISDQNTKIEWRIYKGDSKDPLNLVKTIKSDATILTNTSHTFELQLFEKEFPLYHIVGEVSNRDSKSIIEIRYTRKGVSATQVLSSSVNSYPLMRGNDNTISSCVYNAGEESVIRDQKVLIELQNSTGKVVESFIYDGPITREVMSIKKDFKSSKNLNTFSLHTKILKENNVVSESIVNYDCKVLDPEKCKINFLTEIWYTLGGLLLIIFLLFVVVKMKRSKNIILPMFLLVLFMFLFLNPSVIEAKSVNVSGSVNSITTGGFPATTLGNINLYTSYAAEARYFDTNAIIPDGTSLTIGTKIRLNILPDQNISWLAYNPTYADGWGFWISGAGPLPSIYACYGTPIKTITTQSSPNAYSQSFYWSHTIHTYLNVSIDPGNKTISSSGNLSCESLSGNTAACTVIGTGPISATFNFPGTSAKFYISKYNEYVNVTNGVSGCTPGTYALSSNPNPVSLSPNSISFWFTGVPVVPPNQPPNPPIITGPITGTPTTSYEFGFQATDPDTDDTIRYGIDWDNDAVVDEYLPSVGYVASDIKKTGSKSWANIGAKSFKARTEDQSGAMSTWTSYSITLENLPANGSCGNTNNSCLVGGTSDLIDSATDYNWSCTGLNGGTTASCTIPKEINGSCGLTNNICLVGDSIDSADSATQYLWSCVGSYGGTTDSCTLAIPTTENGICGTTDNDCVSGTYRDTTDNGTESRWYCDGINGGTNSDMCTFDTTGPAFTVSCFATPNPVILPSNSTTFTGTTNARAPVTYTWEDLNGIVSGNNSSTLLRTYTDDDLYNVTFSVKKGLDTVSKTCSVLVQCDPNEHHQGDIVTACDGSTKTFWDCDSSGWIQTTTTCPPPPPTATFSFDPSVVGVSAEKCGLNLIASNVSSCALLTSGGTSILISTTSPQSILRAGERIIPVGRYTLSCTGLGATPVIQTFGTKTCLLNPDLREI